MENLNSLFGLNGNTVAVEEDRIGSGKSWAPLPTDIYNATLKYAYFDSTAKGTPFVQVVLDVQGKTINPKPLYIAYADSHKPYKTVDGKQVFTPAWRTLDSLAFAVTGKSIGACALEEKVIQKYNYDVKKEVPVKVKCFSGLIDVDIKVALKKYNEYKKSNVNGTWIPTSETRAVNIVDKYFSKEGKTAEEIVHNKPAEFATKWLEVNKGKEFTEKLPDGVTPVANATTATTAEPASPAVSLFDD